MTVNISVGSCLWQGIGSNRRRCSKPSWEKSSSMRTVHDTSSTNQCTSNLIVSHKEHSQGWYLRKPLKPNSPRMETFQQRISRGSRNSSKPACDWTFRRGRMPVIWSRMSGWRLPLRVLAGSLGIINIDNRLQNQGDTTKWKAGLSPLANSRDFARFCNGQKNLLPRHFILFKEYVTNITI